MPNFTGRKAMAQNLAKDGIKIRAAKFKSPKAYDRKTQGSKSWKNEG